MKEVKPILSKSEYEIALVEASNFFDAEPILGSREAERFEILINLIESYEDKRYQISRPDETGITKSRINRAN